MAEEMGVSTTDLFHETSHGAMKLQSSRGCCFPFVISGNPLPHEGTHMRKRVIHICNYVGWNWDVSIEAEGYFSQGHLDYWGRAAVTDLNFHIGGDSGDIGGSTLNVDVAKNLDAAGTPGEPHLSFDVRVEADPTGWGMGYCWFTMYIDQYGRVHVENLGADWSREELADVKTIGDISVSMSGTDYVLVKVD